MQGLILKFSIFIVLSLLVASNSTAEVFNIGEGRKAFHCRVKGNKVTAGLFRRKILTPASRILASVSESRQKREKRRWRERRDDRRRIYARMRYQPPDLFFSGVGIDTLAVRLSSERSKCQLLDMPNTLTIEEFNGGCDLSIEPVDHSVNEVNLRYVTFDAGIRSLPGNLKLT